MIKVLQEKEDLKEEVVEAFNRAEESCVVIPLIEYKHVFGVMTEQFHQYLFAVHYLYEPRAGKQEIFTTPQFLREFGKH